MKALAFSLAALLLLAIACAFFAPATLLDEPLRRATAGTLRAADARGSLWHGEATLTDAQGTSAASIRWRLDPVRAVRGVVALTLSPAADATSGPRGAFAWRAGELSIDGLTATLPAAWLNAALASGTSLGGMVSVDIPEFSATTAAYSGHGTLRWHDAAVSLPGLPALSLGEVVVALAPRGQALAGVVSNSGGQVQTRGELVASPERTTIDLALVPQAGASVAIARALSALPRGDGQGAARIRWQGPAMLSAIAP